MAERQWNLGTITAKEAAVEVVDWASKQPEHSNDLAQLSHVNFRAFVRHAARRLYPYEWETGGNYRHFSSALAYEVKALVGGDPLTAVPIWAKQDATEYEAYLASLTHPSLIEWAKAHSNPQYNAFPTKSNQENHMSLKATQTKLIETRVFIKGVDASTMSDDAIFQAIAEAELEIDRLEQINNKPEKLGRKITKLYKAIAKVKAYVDNR